MPALAPLTPHTPYVRRPGNVIREGNHGTLQALLEDPQYGGKHSRASSPFGTIRIAVFALR